LLFFVGVLAVRLTIGMHFFQEGTAKIRAGDFTARYFLSEAKGPWAGFFKSYVDDPDGTIRLCLQTSDSLTASVQEMDAPVISPDFTFLIWGDFADQIRDHYQFGDPNLIRTITERMKASQVELQKSSDDPQRESLIKQRRVADEGLLKRLQNQLRETDRILEDHQQMLRDFLDENRAELVAHFGSMGRLQGFWPDGKNKQAAAAEVASLKAQVESIKADRQRKFQGWVREVETIWDSLETQLNELAVDRQRDQSFLAVHRPFDQPYSWQKFIDGVIPWFDTILGALLIVGLFTRFASLAAALFLLSVIATQPPWIAGAAPTSWYLLELVGCLLLVVVGAGRFGGMDFFLSRRPPDRPLVPSTSQAGA
jgi:uncharacterized membrane protein YphA (DoxX/SURF4 family)